MATLGQVLADLDEVGGSKSALMQKYSELQQEIIRRFGGNFTDVPVDKEGVYAQIQDKINILNRMV